MQPTPKAAMPARPTPSHKPQTPQPQTPKAQTPKAAAEASAGEPTAAKPKKKRKKKRKKAAEPLADGAVRAADCSGEAVAGPLVMVMDAGAARTYRGKCLYQSRKCENERALKRNGLPHNLCEEHRSKQNLHQRKFDAKKISRKRRNGSDAEPDGDGEGGDGEGEDGDDGDREPDADGSNTAPRKKKRLRVPIPMQQTQQTPTQQRTQTRPPLLVTAAASLAPVPPRVSTFASTPAPLPPTPHLASLVQPIASALYVGAISPLTSGSGASAPLGLGHRAAMGSQPLLDAAHRDFQRQAATSRLPPPHPLNALAGRSAAGYTSSELEAARMLVPTSMAAPTGAPAAYADARTVYQHSPHAHHHQQYVPLQPHPQPQPQPQPMIRQTASTSDPVRGDCAMLLRPQVDARPAGPTPHVLPPLLHPPSSFVSNSIPRPHSFPPGVPMSAASPLTLRSPLVSAAGPLLSVPRLLPLGSAPMPLVSSSAALPSLAPLRASHSPLGPPATSR